MKPIGCLVLIVIIGWSPVCAQNNLQLSMEAGPNFTNLEQVDTEDFKSAYDSGDHLGVLLQFPLNRKFRIYTGVGFSELHFNRTYTTGQFGYGDRLPDVLTLAYKFKTIDIPVGISYSIPFEVVAIGFNLGLRPVFISGKNGESFSTEDTQGFIRVEADISNEMNNTGLLAEVGTELRYKLAESTSVYGGLRYGYSISKMYESEGSSGRLSRLDILLGLSFNLF